MQRNSATMGSWLGNLLIAGLFGLSTLLYAEENGSAQGAAGATQGAGGEQYAKKGAGTCLKCHDEFPVKNIFETPHAQKADARTPFATHECETCHGASPDHVQNEPAQKGDKRTPPHTVFGRQSKNYPVSDAADQNKVCLGCHESGIRMHWRGSQHESSDLACATCHTIHAPKDPVLVKTSQPEVCYTCHVEQRAQMRRFSRHPIREGKVVCSNCHNPHGGPGSNLVKNTVNETCYQCHAEKRGPFLYEHQPVRESCTLCHDPHGSTQTRMLVQRPPFLCQSCHSSDGGHPSILRDASLLPPSTDLNNRFLLAKGCLNCHSQVHGSNHPSGMFFTR